MQTTEHAADLIVIGTGGAAMAAGIEARSRDNTVLLVEHGPLGGTCLNIGCVPSKNLLAAAGQRHRALANRFPMVPTSADGVDVPALMAQKQDLIGGMRQAKYADVADAHGFPIRNGHARFVDGQTLEVGGERLRAPAYLIATGTAPHVPDLPGLSQVAFLTSTTAMEQQDLPGSMVVIGAGTSGWSRPSCGPTSEPASTSSAGSPRTANPRSPRYCAACSPTTASRSSRTAPSP